MDTKPQQAGAWLSVFAHGLGIILGVVLFIWEMTIDDFKHPIIIPSIAILLGIRSLAEPAWRTILRYMLRTNRVELQIGPWLKFQSSPLTGAQVDLPVVTVAVETIPNQKPPLESRITPLQGEHPSPKSHEDDTPIK
jgi:hypothetical protein